MTEIEQLKQIVLDENMPIDSRREAAALLIRLEEEAIVSKGVEDDDPEVVQIMQPWPRDTALNASIADMFAPVTNGRSINGWDLVDARAEVLKQKVLRQRLQTVVDESLPRVLREAGAAAVKAVLPSGNHFEINSVSPSAMVDKAKLPTGTKWTSASRGPVPVVRPPVEYSDLW